MVTLSKAFVHAAIIRLSMRDWLAYKNPIKKRVWELACGIALPMRF